MASHLLDEHSQLSSKSEVQLFDVPPTQVAVQNGYWAEVYPTTTLTTTGPWSFHITPDPFWLDLNRNYLHAVLKITKADGGDVGAAVAVGAAAALPKVAPINLISKCFFRQCKIWLNNKLVSDSDDVYSYRCYLESMLNFGMESKTTHMQAGMYYPDEAGSFNTKENQGFKERGGWCARSREFEVMGCIHSDITNQDRLMVSHMDVKVQLFRNTDDFCLMSCDNTDMGYKIEVKRLTWFVRKVDLLPSLSVGLEAQLSKTPAKYPIRRIVVKTLNMAAGARDMPETLVFSGQVPRRILVALVGERNFIGQQDINPFDFQNFDIRRIQVTAAGQNYPRNSFEMDFTNKRYVRAYTELFETLGTVRQDISNGISYSDFANGFCVLGVDLSPDGSDATHWQLIRSWSTFLKLVFDTAIPQHGIKVIVVGEFDNCLIIDGARNCFADYTL